MSEALPFVPPTPSPWAMHCRKCKTTHTAPAWARLRFVGYQPDVDMPALELRLCTCGTCLSVPVGVP
jgi:hypothetical protein